MKILNIVAKVIEKTAKVSANSTSIIIAYQPKKPECLKEAKEKR